MKTLRLLISLAIALLFASTSIARADSGAEKTVDAFYHAYMGHGWTDLFRTRKYLTPSLYGLLDDVASKSKHEEVLDFDPFIFAQEEARSVSVLRPIGSGTRVIVPVLVHYRGSGQQRLRVIVTSAFGGWKIDNIEYPNSDLRHEAEKALK